MSTPNLRELGIHDPAVSASPCSTRRVGVLNWIILQTFARILNVFRKPSKSTKSVLNNLLRPNSGTIEEHGHVLGTSVHVSESVLGLCFESDEKCQRTGAHKRRYCRISSKSSDDDCAGISFWAMVAVLGLESCAQVLPRYVEPLEGQVAGTSIGLNLPVCFVSRLPHLHQSNCFQRM